MKDTRTERDSMGEMQVPASALYGASTARAVELFVTSGQLQELLRKIWRPRPTGGGEYA